MSKWEKNAISITNYMGMRERKKDSNHLANSKISPWTCWQVAYLIIIIIKIKGLPKEHSNIREKWILNKISFFPYGLDHPLGI